MGACGQEDGESPSHDRNESQYSMMNELVPMEIDESGLIRSNFKDANGEYVSLEFQSNKTVSNLTMMEMCTWNSGKTKDEDAIGLNKTYAIEVDWQKLAK